MCIRDRYKEASYKPYVIAAMIMLAKFADPADILKKLEDRCLNLAVLAAYIVDVSRQTVQVDVYKRQEMMLVKNICHLVRL